MTRRFYWLSVIFSTVASFSYVFWCWHDNTNSVFWVSGALREQTRADHTAAIGYALARVLLTLGVLELAQEKGPRE